MLPADLILNVTPATDPGPDRHAEVVSEVIRDLDARRKRLSAAYDTQSAMTAWARKTHAEVHVSPNCHHVWVRVEIGGRQHRIDWWPEDARLVVDSKFKRAQTAEWWRDVVRVIEGMTPGTPA